MSLTIALHRSARCCALGLAVAFGVFTVEPAGVGAVPVSSVAEQQSPGQLGQGAQQLRRVSESLEKQLGAQHPLVLRSWLLVASFLEIEGEFVAADRLYRHVLEARLASLGPDHLDTAEAAAALAGLRTKQGRFDEALSLHQQALSIREKHRGASASATLESLQGLAALYSRQGQWDVAERLWRQVLQRRRRQLGEQHPETLLALNNLGMLMERQSRWHEAELFYRQAQVGFEQVWGKDDLAATLAAENLARMLMLRGELVQAESLQRRALAARERLLGKASPRLAVALGNLAETLTIQGREAQATPLLERGLLLMKAGTGAEHPEAITLLQNLAVNRWLRGRSEEGLALMREAQDLETLQLQREVSLLPQSDRSALLNSVGEAWLAGFSMATEHPSNPASIELAWRARLNRHGLLQSLARHQAMLSRQSGSSRELVQRLQSLQTQLADLSMDLTRRQALLHERAELERQLYRSLPQLQPTVVTPESVARALPASGVLVELQRYERFDPRQPPASRWGTPQLIALVLPSQASGRQPSLIPLGDLEPFEQAVKTARLATLRGDLQAEGLWLSAAERLWLPLQTSLQGYDHLALSLDGDLHQIPIAFLQAALPAVQMQLLTSGRDLLVGTPPRSLSPPLVLADPVFATTRTGQGALARLGPWSRLPASLQEGRHVAEVLDAGLLHGSAATATRLSEVRHPVVLHVATHGYFLPEPSRGQPAGDGGMEPLQRSGLVLAPSHNDSYLTAAEVSVMDLEGTRLVTLSACDTGRGVRRTGEAVYGLQRALRVAGAQATLLSLWKVDDRATRVWMERFYALTRKGIPLWSALQQVQQQFRIDPELRNKGWSHPFYWAAWQLVGGDLQLLREDGGPTPLRL